MLKLRVETSTLCAAAAAGFMNQLSTAVVTSDAARDLLQRYMERGRQVTMRAIVEQRINSDSDRMMQIKLEQDSKGRRKATVLQPLSMQAIQSLDDGKRWFNYHPDEARLYVQASPSLHSENVKARLKLAGQNYTFSFERTPDIAGRNAAVVVATPRFAEMPTRRFSIEFNKSVLLRLEIQVEGERQTLFDTKAILFPTSLPSSTFEIKPVGDVRTIEKPNPVRITSKEEAISAAGIAPILPNLLPFGFVVRDPELTGEEDCRMIAVRVTDGLVYATVYQWGAKGTSGKVETGGRTMQIVVNGIRMRLVGDLPEGVRKRILEHFAKEAGRANGLYREPFFSSAALNGTRESNSEPGRTRTSIEPKSPHPPNPDDLLARILVQILATLSRQNDF